MEIIKTRSATAAQKIADERGLAVSEYEIVKIATAKYELRITPLGGSLDQAHPGTQEFGAKAEFDAEAWIAQELAKATSAADADRYLAMGPEFTAEHHHRLAEAIRAKFATSPKAVRVNRHWNNDGSLTLYVFGIKLRRIGGEEEEGDDPEEIAETFLNKTYPRKKGGWAWGRETSGHNWHTKRQKALRQAIAEGQAAGKNVADLEAELAKISG